MVRTRSSAIPSSSAKPRSRATASTATLRDRLVYNQVQGAQMLAPLAVAVTLGLSQQPAALAAPYKLNVNGN
ncbi:ABC transporter substrate-binding protein, partial [Xylella fastidiosa]|uniref:ABC transporter substrate-binding protein n=1 Tax=Xylella fastidiosa TaxID=2371 RepID=UPI0034E0BF1E